MNQPSWLARLASILTVAVVFLFYGNAMNVIGPSTTVWLLGIMVATSPIVLFSLRYPFKLPRVSLWLYGFLLVVAIGMLSDNELGDATATLTRTILFILVFSLVYVLLSFDRAIRAGIRAVAVVSGLSVVMNIYESFNPSMFSVVTGRSAGFYLNPNTSATAMVWGMIIGNRAIPPRWTTVYQLAIGGGVVLTASRSGVILWLVGFLCLQLSSASSKTFARSWFIVVTASLVIVVSPIWNHIETAIAGKSDVYASVVDRLSTTTEDAIEDPRLDIISASLEVVSEKPILGHGTGTPRIEFSAGEPQGTHNQYLSLWIQHGVIGLTIIPVLALFIARTGRRNATSLTLSLLVILASFFTHNLMIQWQYAVVIAITIRLSMTLDPPSSGCHLPCQGNGCETGSASRHRVIGSSSSYMGTT